METSLKPSGPVGTAAIPQAVIVIGGILLCCLVYGFASGSGSGRYLEGDRLVIAECWKSIDRRASSEEERRSLADGCARMERGFHMKHGATL